MIFSEKEFFKTIWEVLSLKELIIGIEQRKDVMLQNLEYLLKR